MNDKMVYFLIGGFLLSVWCLSGFAITLVMQQHTHSWWRSLTIGFGMLPVVLAVLAGFKWIATSGKQ